MTQDSIASPLPRLLRAQEVADHTGLTVARVYELARGDDMPSIRLGRAVRFDAAALRAWLAEGGAKRGGDAA